MGIDTFVVVYHGVEVPFQALLDNPNLKDEDGEGVTPEEGTDELEYFLPQDLRSRGVKLWRRHEEGTVVVASHLAYDINDDADLSTTTFTKAHEADIDAAVLHLTGNPCTQTPVIRCFYEVSC